MQLNVKSPENQLDTAIKIAITCHYGQKDKSGKPYILHPLHIMRKFLDDPELAAIAVLHDCIEDGGQEIVDMIDHSGLSMRVVSAVACLTHSTEETYGAYIDNICCNMDAIRVKLADLEHNSDITRLKGLREKDFERMKKYHKAYIKLTDALNSNLRAV